MQLQSGKSIDRKWSRLHAQRIRWLQCTTAGGYIQHHMLSSHHEVQPDPTHVDKGNKNPPQVSASPVHAYVNFIAILIQSLKGFKFHGFCEMKDAHLIPKFPTNSQN